MSPPPNLSPAEALPRAAALLQAGQHAHARELLAGLVREYPQCAEAYSLIAGSCFQTGDLVRALKAARAWVRLAPESAEAHSLMGRILIAGNQQAEAELALREALRIDPMCLAAAVALTRLTLASGRVGDACGAIEPFALAKTAALEAWLLYGMALASSGRPMEAAGMFRQILEREPGNQEARLRLAAALADCDQGADAETQVRHVMSQGLDSADTAFVLARALMAQGRFAEAEIELHKAVRARPWHVTAQANLSELGWMRSGDIAQATAALDEALAVHPELAALRIVKSRLLLSAGYEEDALGVVEGGLAHVPNAPDLLSMASGIALNFDPARALELARRALRVAPEDAGALTAFGNASLGVGHAREALATAQMLQQRVPLDGQSLAMEADALRLLGDPRSSELLDYEHFLHVEFIDTPAGWPDLETYLADLATALEASHAERSHPIGNSLRQGSQLELVPGRSGHAAIRAFPQAINGPVCRYMQALGRGDDSFRRRNSGRYRIQGMWSVRLRPHGFHVNHYHPQGWISSACYLHLPPAVQARGGAGWLKFGEPPFPTIPKLEAEYFLKPLPGLLALFPSYMWHGTVPFSGGPEDTRLTIAFDIVPVEAVD
jgi:tetratricopeptide (TPR) repeat protein